MNTLSLSFLTPSNNESRKQRWKWQQRQECVLSIPIHERIIVRQAHVLGAAMHAGATGSNLPVRPGLDKTAGIQKPLQFAWKD